MEKKCNDIMKEIIRGLESLDELGRKGEIPSREDLQKFLNVMPEFMTEEVFRRRKLQYTMEDVILVVDDQYEHIGLTDEHIEEIAQNIIDNMDANFDYNTQVDEAIQQYIKK